MDKENSIQLNLYLQKRQTHDYTTWKKSCYCSQFQLLLFCLENEKESEYPCLVYSTKSKFPEY